MLHNWFIKFDQAIERVLLDSGMTEDELVEAFCRNL